MSYINNQSEIPPAHIFGFAEDFTVFLSVIDDHGCTNRERKTISVKTYNDYPEVMMSSDRSRSCDPQLDVKFSNFTEDENVVSFFWDFGDGTTYTGKTPPTHHYSGYNTYRATLQAVSKNIYYTPPPPKNKGENGSHTYIDAFFSVFVTKSFPQNARKAKVKRSRHTFSSRMASIGVMRLSSQSPYNVLRSISRRSTPAYRRSASQGMRKAAELPNGRPLST